MLPVYISLIPSVGCREIHLNAMFESTNPCEEDPGKWERGESSLGRLGQGVLTSRKRAWRPDFGCALCTESASLWFVFQSESCVWLPGSLHVGPVSVKKGPVSRAANTGSLEGTLVSTRVNKRKAPAPHSPCLLLKHAKSSLHFEENSAKSRYCSFSSFSMDLTEVSQRTDEK